MKGLIKKDLIYLREQFVLLIIMALLVVGSLIGVAVSGKSISMGFINGYFTVLEAVILTSTISYDQSDNGMAYLMTMPITRKMYVNSKYMETLVVSVATGVIVILINMISTKLVGGVSDISQLMLICATVASIIMVISSIGIPAYLKFEARKGSMAMIVTTCIIGLVCFGLIKTLDKLGFDVEYMINTMSNAGTSALAAMAVVVALICLVISYGISVKVINAKEF